MVLLELSKDFLNSRRQYWLHEATDLVPAVEQVSSCKQQSSALRFCRVHPARGIGFIAACAGEPCG